MPGVKQALYWVGGVLAVSMCGHALTSRDEPAPTAAPTATPTSRPAAPMQPAAAVVAEPDEPCPEPIGVWARDLVAAYQKNEVRADMAYKDQALAFGGIVRDISSGPNGRPIVDVDGVYVYGMTQVAAAQLNRGEIFDVRLAVGTGSTITAHPTVTVARDFFGEDPCGDHQAKGVIVAFCNAYPRTPGCEPPKSPKVDALAKKPAAKKRQPPPARLELPCRPGQTPPCFD